MGWIASYGMRGSLDTMTSVQLPWIGRLGQEDLGKVALGGTTCGTAAYTMDLVMMAPGGMAFSRTASGRIA